MDQKTGESRVRYQQIFESIDTSTRKSKIICTLGSACCDIEMLVKMLDAGMNVARIDFSEGDFQTHDNNLAALGAARKQRPEKNCAVLLETKGPKIYTGFLKDSKPVCLTAGQTFKIINDYSCEEGDNTWVACTYKQLPQSVAPGSVIYFGNGDCTLEVTEKHEDCIVAQVKNDYTLTDQTQMILPGAKIDIPTITEADTTAIEQFGLLNQTQVVDYVCPSFVRQATDVQYLRNVLVGKNVKIISKIQTHEALDNFDAILEESDGIMISRQHLSLEIPPEKVFIAQKWMIEKCNLAAKPVMIISQMLESMCKAARPTRAEASDVANAILDGVDGIVLSEETAVGDYPINAVSILAKCCVEAEKTIDFRKQFNDLKLYSPAPYGTAESVAQAAVSAVLDMNVDKIIVVSETGQMGRLISKFKPDCEVFVCSPYDFVVRQLTTCRGVTANQISGEGDDLIQVAISEAKKQKLIKVGHKVVAIHSLNEEKIEEQNIMKIVNIE